MKTVYFLFSLILIESNALLNQPSDPILPDTFYVQFNETLYYNNSKAITPGAQWYDYPSRRGRIDREDGLHDRFCYMKGMPLTSELCSHLVVIRWIVHPRLKQCCP